MDLNDAGDLFSKGRELVGGIARQARDIATTAGLRAQILDKNMELDKLFKQLGKAVFDSAQDAPELKSGNDPLFASIEACIEARQQLEDKLSEAQARTDASRPIDIDPIEADDVGQDEAASGVGGVSHPDGDEQERVEPLDEEATFRPIDIDPIEADDAGQDEAASDEADAAGVGESVQGSSDPSNNEPASSQVVDAGASVYSNGDVPAATGWRSATAGGSERTGA